MRKPGLAMYTKYIYSYNLPYCTRYTYIHRRSVNCKRLPMKCCINAKNHAGSHTLLAISLCNNQHNINTLTT